MAPTEKALELPNEVRGAVLGDWWARKNRGRSFDLDIEASNPVDLVETIGSDQLAQVCMVACQLFPRDGAAIPPAVVGTVAWGTDGFQSTAEFDFSSGTVLCISGSFVRLSARIDRDAPGNGGAAMPPVRVGAHVGYGAPERSSVFRTRYFEFAGAGALTVAVPAFARSVRVLKSVAAAALTVEQLDRAGNVLTQETGAGQFDQEVPNDSRQLRLTAVGAVSARALFTLFL